MSTSKKSNGQCNNYEPLFINVNESDIILTPLTCASIVNEIMKNLLYQKSQIPYPYTWLKNIVNKKRRSLKENSADQRKNFILYKHFQTVSSTFDSLESIMTSISNQFVCLRENLKEIVFVIGVTPFCPQEIFRIKILGLAEGHKESYHMELNSRKQSKVLRDIFLSQNWMQILDHSVPSTYTYIFLRICKPQSDVICDNNFILSKPLIISPKTKQINIYLNYVDPQMCSCCESLKIFQDVSDSESSREVDVKTDLNDFVENEELWLQSKSIVQGFKDSYINKVSVCELW